jgi:hypothetical protein
MAAPGDCRVPEAHSAEAGSRAAPAAVTELSQWCKLLNQKRK